MACKFIMACCNESTIYGSMIQKQKQRKKLYDDVAHIVPCHINLGPHISMS
jgi:hypothetical protein